MLPFLSFKAKLAHSLDTNVEKELKESVYYRKQITLEVIAPQCENKKCNRTDYELYKLVKMPNHKADKADKINVESPKETSSQPQQPISEPMASQQPTSSLYYKLSYVKSLAHFYIHTNESLKHLAEIEEELAMEYETKKELEKVSTLVTGKVYGYNAVEEGKFYRIRIMESGEAFFLDYGNVCRVDNDNVFELSEWIERMAPEAICCKLSGFEDRQTLTELTNNGYIYFLISPDININ